MSYQAISDTKPDPQSSKSKRDNPCQVAWNWIIQILTWAALVYIIIFFINFDDWTDSYYDPDDYYYTDEFTEFEGICIPCGFIYVAYIISMFCSPTFRYLCHRRDGDRMYKKMGELFRAAPVISFTAQCYHYETRHHTYRDKDGHVHHTTSTVRVNTHYERMVLPYYSAKDVSGLFLLDLDKASQAKKAFIKLHLKKEINFADAISYSDYTVQKEAFWRRNRYRDVYMEFHEYREIPGFTEFNLVQIGDKKPACVNLCLYILFIFIPFCQLYKSYVDSYCVPQNYKIRKIVSTRYNLLEPAYTQQYQSITPALNLNDQMYSYNAEDTGFCYESAKVQAPTEEELQAAQQYSSQIPNYGITSVGGEVNGVQVGVVQDIPSFNEANYNVPPPSFASVGGNVALSPDQLNQEGNNGGNIPQQYQGGEGEGIAMPMMPTSSDEGYTSGGNLQ